METIRQTAMTCVGRAVFFGYLAISMVMLGSIFDLVLFFRSGAILAFVQTAVLVWFAQTAQLRDPKTTETWILLSEKDRPHNDHARRAFANVMKEVYLFYATYTFAAGAVSFVVSILFAASGYRYLFEN